MTKEQEALNAELERINARDEKLGITKSELLERLDGIQRACYMGQRHQAEWLDAYRDMVMEVRGMVSSLLEDCK